MATVGDIVSHLNALRPGYRVVLSIIRDKKPYEVDITLAEWDDTCQ